MVGMNPLKPSADCRMLKMVSPSLPQPGSPGQLTGIFDGRQVAFHAGFDALEVVDRIEHDFAEDLQARLVRVGRAFLGHAEPARRPAHPPR